MVGVPKSLTDMAARAVNALERIADGFDEQDTAVTVETINVSPSYPQEPNDVGKRILTAYARITEQHAKSIVAILDDDQNEFEKAKRLRMMADAMSEFANGTNAQWNRTDNEVG